MPAGNRARNRPKGFHLSTDACEMLNQMVIVLGGTESQHVNQAVRDLFIRMKLQYREAFGEDYWDSCLDAVGHINWLKNRPSRRISKA